MTELRIIRDGGNISRFHTRKMIQRQDVAQHSFNAAFIAESISHKTEGADDHKVVMHMLLHDIPELWIGDTPGHIKAQNPGLKANLDEVERRAAYQNFAYRHLMVMYHLNEREELICKFADLAECAFKAIEEMEMGNTDAKAIVDSCIDGMVSALEGAVDTKDPGMSFEMATLVRNVIDANEKFKGEDK